MAAKDKKSAFIKQLNKDNQSDKLIDTPKPRRGRKSAASVLTDDKAESKSPISGRKKRKECPQDGRITPVTRKRRNMADVEEEHEPAKTPPHGAFKSKKTFLEKELEDILENATGRNTPSTPRNRKQNDKDEETGEADKYSRTRRGGSDSLEVIEDKSGVLLSKLRKTNEKEVDDDNMSVRSFTNLRTRKNIEKDIDDDVLSVRSVSLKSRKNDLNNDDTSSLANLPRSNLIKKVGRKKKTVPVVVKKKLLMKRGRPKKNQSDPKTKIVAKKKNTKKGDELVEVKESKRLVNKSLKLSNMIGTQRRLRSAMLLKKQKLKKTITSEDKNKQPNPRSILLPVKGGENSGDVTVEQVKGLDGMKTDFSGGEVLNVITAEDPKKGACKRKFVKRDGAKNGDGKFRLNERGDKLQYYAEGETTGGKSSLDKVRQTKMRLAKKLANDSKKRKRVKGIHFEATSSPDDSSVIIVQPCLGPKMKYSRLKHLLHPNQKMEVNGKEAVPKNVLPITSSATNFNQIGGPYFVQSIPNFKVLATNSTIIRRFSNATVNPSFDSSKPVSLNNMPYIESSDKALSTMAPKVSPKDIIVTPSGIVLSSSGLISTGNQHAQNICINGPNTAFFSDASNGNILYTAQKSVGNVSTTKLFYQNSSNIINPQSCTNTTTAILVERPETMSTSLISTTTTGTVVINSDGGLTISKTVGKGYSASTQTDTTASEKAVEGSSQASNPKSEQLPTIPVAKNVMELLQLKSKTSPDSSEKKCDKTDVKSNLHNKLYKLERRRDKRLEGKRARRMLRNVRHNHSSVSELTFSEPENSCCEQEETNLYKTISYERLDKSFESDDINSKVLLQLGSEPMPISESIAPFETASGILLDKSDKIDKKLNKMEFMALSPKMNEAVEVCHFSKENIEALRELGLDSDLDQTKSEIGSSPIKMDEDVDTASEKTKKEKIKEEVDSVLKEMPNRKISNLLRKSGCYNLNKSRIEVKNPLVLKNNDYLIKSSSMPPTVIDKLLERNKSLKKAEQEGKYQNNVHNHSENLNSYEKDDIRHRRSLREVRTRKFSKVEQRRLVANKRFVSTNSGCKVFERRGSNPELYSNNYLTTENKVSNENMPLRRTLEIREARDKYPRRGSIDFDSIQKVMERRSSLPIASDNTSDDGRKKTEIVKTILLSSGSPLTSKNHGNEQQTRVINIITGDDGSKKGQNLMEEIGMKIEKEVMGKAYMNGEKEERRTSVESSNSEPESLQKLMDGITVSKSKSAKEVPYSGENSLSIEKIILSVEAKNSAEKKIDLIEENPEDMVKKETILSALGLQRTIPRNTQKKESSSCQSENGNYTGTLKTVIKIHRQEKKGNSKTPMKMIYKASSSSSSVSGQTEEHNLEADVDGATKDDTEEETKNGNGKAKSLVIPEKASSFSIHPGRLCSDVCAYCFGKFGLLDTPCHIAQLKDAHKRRNILATETHLLADSCLCDACFRHVDKKSNCPSFTEKKIDKRKFNGRKQLCCARNCNGDPQHSLRGKWFAKLKRSIGRKIVLDQAKLEKLQPTHLISLCNRHFYWIDYFMSCGLCKKRLTSVNMYRVGPDVMELNAALSADGIPTILTEKRFLCKICHCYASIRIKYKDLSEMSHSQCQFYETYRKRILQCHEIEVPDSEGESENRTNHKTVKKTKKSSKPTATITNEASKSDNETEISMEELDKGAECEKDNDMKEVSHMNIPPKTNGNLDFGGVSITPSTTEVNPTQIHVKLGNLNIGALGNLNIGQDVRHGARTGEMPCFPTEAELALRAHFDLQPSAEDESAKAPRKGFEKCTTTIQFNSETKNLFYSLQMPYGNNSSFFRHLILLEKYFRSGDLVISRNADPKAVNYISSVQNRIRSYEGIHNPVKKPLDIPPSLSILPQPIKTESKNLQEIQPSVIQSRPFTLTPMPSTTAYPKNSPLSHIQATVQNIPSPNNQSQSQGFVGSLLKSMNQPKGNYPKPEISITSVPPDPPPPPVKIGKISTPPAAALTSKIQENLRNLASKSQVAKQPNQARAVILNRTVGGQKQSLVQVTTGGKTIHLTLYQFRRIQQMQMRKKQLLEGQGKNMKPEDVHKAKPKVSDEGFDLKNLSPELEIKEIKQSSNGNEIFPLISDVRSLAGDDSSWQKNTGENSDGQGSDSFPKIPKALSVSVTKIPAADIPSKEQAVE